MCTCAQLVAAARVTCVTQDDEEDRPFVSRIIHRLANYDGGVLPNITVDQVNDDDDNDDHVGKPPLGCLQRRRRTTKTKATQKAVRIRRRMLEFTLPSSRILVYSISLKKLIIRIVRIDRYTSERKRNIFAGFWYSDLLWRSVDNLRHFDSQNRQRFYFHSKIWHHR